MNLEIFMKIAIIGAGPSDLCTAKEILACNQRHELSIFESNCEIGGIFTKSYPGLQLVNNNYLLSFSDYIEETDSIKPIIWFSEEYLSYLKKYATHFKLEKHINFNSKVIFVIKKRNKWKITYSKGGNTNQELFDYLIVSSGSHAQPVMPNISFKEPGKCQVIHSAKINNYESYQDKDVIIIGTGESASDMAFFISKYANSTNISIRRW